MAKPTILAVDDDPQVLSAVRADLRRRYAEDYRIVVADGGVSGLSTVEQLALRGDDVALFLVDQRMPQVTGTQFLVSAREHFPDARKVLLTAYADTEAAISSINEVGLDHYLMKPWDPPEDSLYPVLDDLLMDWAASRPAPFDGIRVIGTRWAASSHEAKDFLGRNQIPYRFLDVERDPDAERLMAVLAEDARALPVVVFPDGTAISQPTNRDLAERVGLQVQASAPFYDLAVVGAGPAGLAAAVYGASEGLQVAVIERQATGGQAGSSSRIENYLGFPNGISGSDLARRAAAQARRFGAEILTAVDAVGLDVDGPIRTLRLSDGSILNCRAVVIASGMTVRQLDVPGYERLTGSGVYYGATLSEAASYRDEDVFVVGGANSAGQGAVLFSRYARSVTLLVRGASLEAGMSQYLVDQISGIDNIVVELSTQVREVRGEASLEQVVIEHTVTGEVEERTGTGLFIFVGAIPHTAFLGGAVACNASGFVLTGPDLGVGGSRPDGWPLERDPYPFETSVPGVFAAGDVRDGAVRRVASAVGQGSTCISLVHQYLATV
ncbi:MAG TPA: FAD-dependent oxidoreductase [Nitriliruptorales bacterium]